MRALACCSSFILGGGYHACAVRAYAWRTFYKRNLHAKRLLHRHAGVRRI